MKKRIAVLFPVLVIMLLMGCCFVACENAPSGTTGTVIPTYQGMTISRTPSMPLSYAAYEPKLAAAENDDAEPINDAEDISAGDPHTDHIEELPEEIEDLVTITVQEDNEVKYYVRPNETFIVEVHISNPDNFEIQSFTLNGKKYANYMFKDGSTMELLLLEVTAPSTSGYTAYSIDAIKYIDGTEIKDVDMSKGEKSIKAGIAYTNPPRANAEVKNLSTTSFSLDITVVDEERLIGSNELAVYLSNGEKVIDTKPLKVGTNTVTFDDLTMSTLYEYGVVTAFDLIDGRDTQIVWLTTETVSTLGAYAITDVTSTQDSISFAVERTGEVGTIDSISLYDATTKALIKSGSAETREFDNLLSNHSYHIYVDFSYMIGGEKVTDWVTVKNVKTVAKAVPSFEIENLAPTQTSFVYEINVTDTDKVGAISKIELLHGNDDPVAVDDLTSREFTGLLSNNDYSVKVTYPYDLNDGVGKQTLVKTANVKTVAKAVPSFSISKEAVTDTTIIATYAMTDPDVIGNVTSVALYKGDDLILINEDKEISFSDLDSYTAYRLVIAYSYDLNDGKGTINDTYEKAYRTTPHVAFTSCKIVNTSAVSEGETIYLQASIENPNKATCTGVVVNGRTYGVVGTTTASKLFVEIVSEGQFDGGDTVLTVEKLLMTLDGAKYDVIPATGNNSGNIFINGKLELLSVDYVDAEGNLLGDWVYPDAEVYVMMTLKNPTDYVIDAIDGSAVSSYDGFKKLDKSHYLWRASISHGTNSVGITTIDYHNDYLLKSANFTLVRDYIYCTADSEVHYISNPDDLKNMNGGYHYVLTQDIDLDGIEWSAPGNFYGVFDGNSYSIKNISFVGTIKNAPDKIRLGLFASVNGIVNDLHIKELLYLVTIEDTPYNLYAGAIAAEINNSWEQVKSIFNRCSVDENSIISINRTSSGYCGIGGLVGLVDNGIFEMNNCQSFGRISSIGGNGWGGIGGMCGALNSDADLLIITNCLSATSISTGQSNGAFVGALWSESALNNCVNLSAIQMVHWIGPEVPNITNCYNYSIEIIAQLNNRSFYTDVLGWDESIWDLNDLDIEHEKYPTLKQR